MATTWYAQLSSQNIDAWAVTQSMIWNDAANGLGNWMQGANFTAGLGAGDVLCANGQTALAVNVSITCLRLSTDAEIPIQGGSTGTAGGGFTTVSAVTITANIFSGTVTGCLTTTGSGYTVTIIGAISLTSASHVYCLTLPGGVDVTIHGSITGAAGSSAGIFTYGSGFLTIFGAVTGGNSGSGILSAATCNISVTGNVIGGTSGGNGIYSYGSSPINIFGDVMASPVAGVGSLGINTVGSSSIYVTGNVIAALTAAIINNDSTGGLIIYSGNLINTATAQAVDGLISVYNPRTSNYVRCPKTSGTVDLALEQAANVRSGTPDGDVTGTMAVPTAAQVLYNVPVDNTVGTYIEATAAQVQTGVGFGPSSSYTGTDLPASGPLVGAGGLVE